jgi:hypothetical protein
MSQIHFMEGWLARQLAAQPWVKNVARYSDGGGLKPVGLAVTATSGQTAQVGMVLGASMMAARCDSAEGWSQDATGPVDANPTDPSGWCDALTAVIRQAEHPHITAVDPHPDNGQAGKNPGIKLSLTDGSAGYLTVWSVKR